MSKSKSGSAPFDLPTVEELKALPQEDRVRLVLDSLTNIQNNLRLLESRHTDVLETLSPNVRKHVEALQELQKEHNELEAKFFEERVELEAKYQKLYEPLYTKRYEIVNGVVQLESNVNKAKEVTEDKKDKGDKEKGVPNFWLIAMKANEMLEAEIQEHDEKALKYLKDIKWCRNDNAKGFKLEFHFDSNPYFSNSFFSKTYHMGGKGGTILEKAIGTEIQWYPGMSLTQNFLIKLPKNGSKNINPITKTENCGTFFKFFNPPQMPDEDDDLNDETAELLKKEIEHDYNIGSTIKDKIIPHAVSWFIGEAVSSDGEDDEDEDDEDDDGYDKEEDEEEVKFGNLLLDAGAKKESEVNQRSAAVLGEGQERPPEWKLQFKLYTD